MTLSSRRGQVIREYFPAIFENKKQLWPNPRDSIGRKCPNINNLLCWQVVGPALVAMGELALSISELLQKHQELLEQGESKPVSISFHMWMIGHTPTSADPTVVFISKSKRKRICAMALLKASSLLAKYPGIKVKTLDKIPAFYTSAEQIAPHLWETSIQDDSVYMIDESRGPCGALIGFGYSKTATLGGILIINGVHYGMSAQHARYQSLTEEEEFNDNRDPPCFDDDSDVESEDFMEITSKASVSSRDFDTDSLEISSTDSSSDLLWLQEDLDSLGTARSDATLDSSSKPRLETQHDLAEQDVACQVPSKGIQGRPISNLSSDCIVNDLDYEVFELDNSFLESYHNKPCERLGEDGDLYTTITSPSGVVRDLAESNVWAITGTTGLIRGTIFKSPYYTQMGGSRTFQEMWTAKFDRKPMQGDSGAWVIDAVTGALYGHIVAGDPDTDMAFVIPAYKVFDDLEQRFGTMPLISTKPTANSRNMFPYSDKSRKQVELLTSGNIEAILRLLMTCLVLTRHEPLICSILSSRIFDSCLERLYVLVDPMDLIRLYLGDGIFLHRFWRPYCPTTFFYDARILYLDGWTSCWIDSTHDIDGPLEWTFYRRTNTCFPRPIDMQVYKRLTNLPPIDHRQHHRESAELLELSDPVVSHFSTCPNEDGSLHMQAIGPLEGYYDILNYSSFTETDDLIPLLGSDTRSTNALADNDDSITRQLYHGVWEKCYYDDLQVACTTGTDSNQSQRVCCQRCGHPIFSTATINTRDDLNHPLGDEGSVDPSSLDRNELAFELGKMFADVSLQIRDIKNVAWTAPASTLPDQLPETYRHSRNDFNRGDVFKHHIAFEHEARDRHHSRRKRTPNTLSMNKQRASCTYAKGRCQRCARPDYPPALKESLITDLPHISTHFQIPNDVCASLISKRHDPREYATTQEPGDETLSCTMPSVSLGSTPAHTAIPDSNIAIVGMSGRFPDTDDHQKLWEMLESNPHSYSINPIRTEQSWKRLDAHRVRHDDSPRKHLEPFDAHIFDISPREIENTDPLQWLLFNTINCDHVFITGRTKCYFDFSEPSFSVDTACSLTAAALQLARTSLCAVFRAVVALASQSLTNLPTCALPAIQQKITSTTYALTDYTCICGPIISICSIQAKIKSDCSTSDQEATIAGVALSISGEGKKAEEAPASKASAAAATSASAAPSPASSAAPEESPAADTARNHLNQLRPHRLHLRLRLNHPRLLTPHLSHTPCP